MATIEERIKKLEEDMELIKNWAPDIWNKPKPIGSTAEPGKR